MNRRSKSDNERQAAARSWMRTIPSTRYRIIKRSHLNLVRGKWANEVRMDPRRAASHETSDDHDGKSGRRQKDKLDLLSDFLSLMAILVMITMKRG